MSNAARRPGGFEDLESVTGAIRRLTVALLKSVIKEINDSNAIPAVISPNALKQGLVDRLTAHFTSLRDRSQVNEYLASKAILEKHYGTRIEARSRQGFSYSPYQAPGASASSSNPYHTPQHRPGLYIHPSHALGHSSTPSGSSAPLGSLTFQPAKRPTFKPNPFLIVKEWVGPVLICPEAPGTSQRSQATLKLQLLAPHFELLRHPTAIHQLRLFCTTKYAYEAAYNPAHPANVEFPITCEVKVNQVQLSVNLRGRKAAAKVLAPELNKNKALYFGGQLNLIDLIYQNTGQKYVLSVAICEVIRAESLARRVRKEKYKSRTEILGAMHRAAEDDDIEMGDVSIGLKCPLSYMRLNAPIRSAVCVHVQCFDALSFFSINEQTPSWQCPICFKTIDPDTLFLDGYVQDILDKVPEEEETVMIDAEGRWHTPNNKYSSEAVVETSTAGGVERTPSLAPASSEQPATAPADSSVTNLKREESTSSLSIPTPAPAGRGKPPVQVFEIDDDDDDSEAVPPLTTSDGPSMQEMEPHSTDTQATYEDAPESSTMASTDDGHRSAHLPPPSLSSSARPSPARHESTAPTPAPAPAPASASAPQRDVIDLTLSDSEDEEIDRGSARPPPPPASKVMIPPFGYRMPAPHSHPGMQGVRAGSTPGVSSVGSPIPPPPSHWRGQPSMTIGAQSNGHKNGSSRGSVSLGSGAATDRPVAALPNGRHSDTSSPFHSTSSTVVGRPPQRRFSSQQGDDEDENEQENENGGDDNDDRDGGDTEEEDGIPIQPHRKKQRYNQQDTRGEKDEALPATVQRRSQSDSGDDLQEDERAGLAVGR